MTKSKQPINKWVMAALTAITGGLCVTAPLIALSVLFDQVSADLNLTIVQVGLVWSLGSLFGIASALISGALGDTIDPRLVLFAGAVMISFSGAARAMPTSFGTMIIAVSFFGFAAPMVSTTVFKLNGLWFPPKQLGLANGLFGMGMAAGFTIGSSISATVLSPWLGGWRPVMGFYGLVSLLISVVWLAVLFTPLPERKIKHHIEKTSLKENYAQIFKVKNIWLISLTMFGVSGLQQSVGGYLPLYLRNLGWEILAADGVFSLLNALGIVAVIPLTSWSDRQSSRKPLMGIMIIALLTGSFLLSTGINGAIWAGAILIGLVRDAIIVLLMTMVLESDGIGPALVGTANGVTAFFMMSGNLLSPPIGNKFAEFQPGYPFIFWAFLALAALVIFQFVQVPRSKQPVTAA